MDISAADNETVRPVKRQKTVAGVDTADASTNDDDDAKISCHVNENNNQLTNATNKDDGDTTTLPPECWAGIMNYLDYDSVLSCAATSKMILRDAMPLVTSLHIEKSSQLNGLSARFRDVQVLNILSLVNVREGHGDSMKVNQRTAMSAVTFMSNFRKLGRVFLGGRDRDGDLVGFHDPNHSYNNEDEQLIRNLMDQISYAFQSNFLSKNLCVQGLRCPKSLGSGPLEISHCTSCQLACKTWPIQHVINFSNKGSSRVTKERSECIKPNRLDVCLTNAQIESLADARPGGNDLLHSESRLLFLLGRGYRSELLSDDGTPFYIIEFCKEDFEEMKRIIDTAKLDVKQLSREDVTNAIMRSFTKDGDGQIPPKSRCHLARYVFRKMKSLGLPVYEEDWLDHLETTKHNLPQMVKCLESEGSKVSFIGITCLYLLNLSLEDEGCRSFLIQRLIDFGVLPSLVKLLGFNLPDHIIAGYVVNIVDHTLKHGTVADTQALLDLGVAAKLLCILERALNKGEEVLADNVAHALGHIAFKSTAGREILLKEGIIPIVSRLLNEKEEWNMKATASWIIRGLCHGSPKLNFSLIKTCVEPLSHLLLSDDENVLIFCSSALFELSIAGEDAKEAVIDSGLYPRLAQLLVHTSYEVQTYALRAISNLMTRDKSLIQPLWSIDVITTLKTFMSDKDLGSRLSSTKVLLHNICREEEYIQAAVSHGCLGSLCGVLTSDDLETHTHQSDSRTQYSSVYLSMVRTALQGLLRVSFYINILCPLELK